MCHVAKTQIYIDIVGLSEKTSRQGNHISVDKIANRMEICVLASFILLKINRAYIQTSYIKWYMVTLLTFCPLWDTKAASKSPSASHKTSTPFQTQNTEHVRFKARLYLLIVPHHQQKQHNIECHEIKIISKISSTMLNFCPQSLARYSFRFVSQLW